MLRGMDCDSFSDSFSLMGVVVFSPSSLVVFSSLSSSIIGVVVVIHEKEDEKAISIGSVSLLTPSMECSRIWETSSKGRSRRRKGLEGVSARVVGVVVLGSEGVVEGGDVMVVVVLVVGDCVEEGILNVLLGSGGWRGVSYDNFSFYRKEGLWCVYSGRYGLYIYICLTLREYWGW